MNAPAPISIVYVEDDDRLARLTAEYVQGHGIEVHRVARGDLALAEVERVRPDVVVLDLMLPGLDGVDVCRQIRARRDVPIIMVTARVEEADKVLGLEGGADDYVTKPVSSRELVARIRAQARRGRGDLARAQGRLVVGELEIDLGAMAATLRGARLALTTHEFSLLRALAQRAGHVLSREQLLELTQGTSSDAFDRSIDVHVSRLRAKLGDDPRNPQLLKTIRGLGYLLSASVS